jgi:hypothetical protein
LPYASDAQRRYLHAREPELAARWDKEMRKGKGRKGKRKHAGRKQ